MFLRQLVYWYITSLSPAEIGTVCILPPSNRALLQAGKCLVFREVAQSSRRRPFCSHSNRLFRLQRVSRLLSASLQFLLPLPQKKPGTVATQEDLLDRKVGTNRHRWTLHTSITEWSTDNQRCIGRILAHRRCKGNNKTMGHCARVRSASILTVTQRLRPLVWARTVNVDIYTLKLFFASSTGNYKMTLQYN